MNISWKILNLLLAVVIFNHCLAQDANGTFFAFKKDGSSAKSIDNCDYFIQKIKKNDTLFICRYYDRKGPMMRQESFKDDSLSIPNGRFCWYDDNGDLDSTGVVVKGRKDKRWEYFLGDSNRATYYDDYDNGKYIRRGTSHQDAATDSLKDSTQKEAQFKGDWNKYLERNLVVPERTFQVLGKGLYSVTVCFLINKEGKIDDVYMAHSIEWAADASVFQMLNKAPAWLPAIQKGKPVYYRQMQNISFRYQ